ncbi:MAG: 2-oxopent-4-enoate hydratase [Porticoccaceae bacterium]|nr:2-oxopent-4-enoate hydratase [Porticoccaceae bacterium]MBT4163282.1 2-oxopent-4-enoate hydratase [Porticoccaceae bacterium]MBT6028323.1 2-oxopent-4-enoate hydratase [Porticoccaceae bacterium]
MALQSALIGSIAKRLYVALEQGTTMSPLTEQYPHITIEDAYHISRQVLQLRMDNDNELVVGKKIGVTSAAVQDMLGVFQPDFGFLTHTMAYADHAEIRVRGNLIQPRAEAEIAFRLKSDLKGPKVTELDVLNATQCIMPCFEIVDSRIENWQIKIQDTISDNASCGAYVLGNTEIDPKGIDLANLEIKVYKNSTLISQGKGSAVQGNPLTAVAWLANTLAAFDIPFLAGEVILSGSLVPLEPVQAGDHMHLELSGSDIDTCTATCCFL